MRILLDECLPRRLKREWPGGFSVATVPECGWAGIKNGRLLASFDIAVIALRAVSNDIDDLRPLVPAVLAALPHARPGTIVVVGA